MLNLPILTLKLKWVLSWLQVQLLEQYWFVLLFLQGANEVDVDTTNFDGILSSSDTDVQKALDTLDNHAHDSTYYNKTELDGGQLDTRYYTETEVDALFNALPESSGQMLGEATIKAISYNAQTIAENITIPSGVNASSVGTVTIEDGYTVEIEDGAIWVII